MVELRTVKIADTSRAHLAATQMRANILNMIINFPAAVKARAQQLEKAQAKVEAFKNSQEGGTL